MSAITEFLRFIPSVENMPKKSALVLQRNEEDVQLQALKKRGTKFVFPEKDDIK